MPRFETAMLSKSYRLRSEDRSAVFETPFGLVIAVADGAGGRSGGAEAAERVVQTARNRLGTAMRVRPSDLCGLLQEIDSALLNDPAAGQSTAVLVALDGDNVLGASAGDSEAWLIGRTGDDVLTRHQQKKPFLGTGSANPVAFSKPAREGALLVATDGLFKYADAGDIAEAALKPDLQTAVTALADLARRENGILPDDLTIVLVCLQALSTAARTWRSK